MFNNSTSVLPLLPAAGGETPSVDRFNRWLPCMLWHLQNETASFNQAEAACSVFEYLEELTTGTKVIYGLTGILIIIPNAAMLWGIIGTRKLHKTIYFHLANLAVSDILAAVGVLCRNAAWVGKGAGMSGLYALMNVLSLIIHSQVMSASALALMSVESYVAVRHPIYFHTHAHTAKRNAVITIVSSWVVLSLLDFSPSMGWNCLDMPASAECYNFFFRPFFVLLASIIVPFGCIMVFTNASVYMAIRKRRKNRLGQAGEVQPLQGNNPAQNVAGLNQPQNVNAVQNEADRKFQKSVQKARTVLIHVVMAFIFLIVPLVLASICSSHVEECPLPGGSHFFLVFLALNAVINPIVSIFRLPDLKQAIWEKIVSLSLALVTMIRRNRVNPQDAHQPAVHSNAPNLQIGAACGRDQNIVSATQPATGHSKTVFHQAAARPQTATFTTKSEDLAIVEVD